MKKIIGFCCNWCSYAGSDLAGSLHYEYPANVRIVRVMCTGRIDPLFIVEALKKGADGVFVSGCHPGDCHYDDGNYAMLRRFKLLERMLEQFGIDTRRVKLMWVSASEAKRFAEEVSAFARLLETLDDEAGRPAEIEDPPLMAAIPAGGD